MRLAAAFTALLGALFVVYGITIEMSATSFDVLGLVLIVLGMVDIGTAWALRRGWLRAGADRPTLAEPGAQEPGRRRPRRLDTTAA